MKLAIVMFLPLVGILATAACASSSSGASGDPSPIKTTDYDTHCTAPSDCIVIADGDVCGCTGCGSAAINKSDQAKYQSDYSSKRSACPSGNEIACPASCILSELTCVAGTCGTCHSPGCGSADAGGDASSDAAHE